MEGEELPDDMVGGAWIERSKSGKYYYRRRRCRVAVRDASGNVIMVGKKNKRPRTRKHYIKFLGRLYDYEPIRRGGSGVAERAEDGENLVGEYVSPSE